MAYDVPERPRYLDHCDKCADRRVIVPPIHVRPCDNGVGEVADYLCPAGHTWFTSWNYGDSAYLDAA
jgi:hypothetical protein